MVLLRLLVIGGTKFVGRHLVESALGANHEVTLFNRGKTNRDLFTDTESLRGDRSKDLSALAGRKWDVVIDTCGYLPADVAADEWLASEGVDPWIELPLWIPEEDGRRPDMVVDCSRARSAGLATRSVVTTAADTLAWHRTRGSGPRGAGMSPDRESELLRKLREMDVGNL